MLSIQTGTIVRNLIIYTSGVAFAVAGALGIVDAISLPLVISAVLFVVGLGLVIAVHELLDGPL